MTLYLVRHAVAVRRSVWRRPQRLRPLAPGGHRQARRLAELLAAHEVTAILSSPHLRCRQTVEPLAARTGVPLELDERLAEGASLTAALAALRARREGRVVVCSHGDLIPALIERLGAPGADLDPGLACEKASTWILEDARGALESATYLPPPAKKRERDGADREGPLRARTLAAQEPRHKHRLAVLDLGSTSFHLVVADALPTGEIRHVLREREMLRLGATIARERRIPDEYCARAVEAARRLGQRADRADAGRLLPVATAALRDAENGRELAEKIGEALRAPVRILRGEEEAALMFAAFRQRMVLPRGLHLGLDLGGGSLELALGDGEAIHWETTLPLGVVRLHGELAPSDPMSLKEERALRGRVRDLLAGARERMRRRAPSGCIATGGTVGSLARWIATRRTRWPTRAVGQLFVPLAELREVAEELVVSTHDQRLATPGVQKHRADLLPTGAVVLEAAVRALGLEGFLVSDWGLREGVMLEELGLARVTRRGPARRRVRRRRRGRGAG